MSGAPTGYVSPKTNWQAADAVTPGDLNRQESNVYAIELGERTLDQAQAPSSHVGTLRQILSWIINRIKAITGGLNWFDAPAITLAGVAARNLTAGNGLTGGGTLDADRTFVLGTPSTVTGTSANNVTATSHTHALSGALLLTGGTMTGILYPQQNTSYTTGQARRIILSTGNPSGGGNGDVWIKYQ